MATHATTQPSQNDPTQIDRKHYTIELENEQVRVLRAKYGPHEKSEMHAHPALIGVMMTDGHIRMSYPDGRTEEITAKAGDIMNMPATVHLPENLTDEAFEVILIELKR
jgi:quercetin dioxygenase-like cupin family protein